MRDKEVNKKSEMSLIGICGGSFSTIHDFEKQAKKEGWTKNEIESVIERCKGDSYGHPIITTLPHSNL